MNIVGMFFLGFFYLLRDLPTIISAYNDLRKIMKAYADANQRAAKLKELVSSIGVAQKTGDTSGFEKFLNGGQPPVDPTAGK